MSRKVDPQLRKRIIERAEHLIHLRGFHHTGMEAIAKACSMTKANLFHHFGSKEELGLAVLDAKMEETRSRRVAPLCSCNDPIGAVSQMFEDCARFYDGIGCRAGCFLGNIALEMSDLNEVFRKRISLFFEEWVTGLEACLIRCQKAGVFDRSLDARGMAETILSLYEGAIMQARARRDATVFLRVGKSAREMLESHKIKTRRKNNHGTQDPLRLLTARH